MTDMPNELWACHKSQEWGDFDQYGDDDVKYIRADIHEALQERNKRLVEALGDIANGVKEYGDTAMEFQSIAKQALEENKE